MAISADKRYAEIARYTMVTLCGSTRMLLMPNVLCACTPFALLTCNLQSYSTMPDVPTCAGYADMRGQDNY